MVIEHVTHKLSPPGHRIFFSPLLFVQNVGKYYLLDIYHYPQDEFEGNHSITLWIENQTGWHYSVFEQPEEHIITFYQNYHHKKSHLVGILGFHRLKVAIVTLLEPIMWPVAIIKGKFSWFLAWSWWICDVGIVALHLYNQRCIARFLTRIVSNVKEA